MEDRSRGEYGTARNLVNRKITTVKREVSKNEYAGKQGEVQNGFGNMFVTS